MSDKLAFRVDLMQGPDRGDWEFRVAEVAPEPYGEVLFFTVPWDVGIDKELVLQLAWDALGRPEETLDVFLSKTLFKLLHQKGH